MFSEIGVQITTANYSKIKDNLFSSCFVGHPVVKHHIESRIIRSYIRLRTGLTVFLQYRKCRAPRNEFNMGRCEVIMQGNLFQRCAHLVYCSVLSLGGNVNTKWMSKLDMGSIFHIKNQWNILVIGNYYVNFQNYQN